MAILGFIFGMTGLSFGLIAYIRLDNLEKQLKESEILDQDFSSQQLGR